jgi:hypothetical protein
VALDPDAAWAIAFRDSLHCHALMQVVLRGIDNAKKTSKPEVPGGGGAPDSGGQDGLAPPRITRLKTAFETSQTDTHGIGSVRSLRLKKFVSEEAVAILRHSAHATYVSE